MKFKPYVTAGFWALSGQNPNSRTVGNFDPLFERSTNMSLTGDAPSWSEFYVYSYGYEEGTYYWTNLQMAQAEAGFTPIKWVTLVGGYAHLDSMYPYAVNPFHAAGSVQPAGPAAGIFGTGTDRGQLAKLRAIYQILPGVQGYINLEKFFPGDFYVPQNNGYWFRAEIVWRYKGFLAFGKQ